MKRVYAVWQDKNGGFHNYIYSVKKPLNHNTVIDAILDSIAAIV